MVKLWIPLSSAVLVSVAVVCMVDMRQRMHQLESRPRIDPAELMAVNTEIARLSVQIQTSTSALRDLAATRTHTAELDKRMSALQCELDSSEQSLEEQRQRLAQWDSMKDQIAPAAIDARIADLRRGVEDRWKGVDDLAQRALGVAQTAQGDFDHLSKGLQRDRERMWRDLLGPTVQMMGEETVGSGVLLASEPIEGTPDYATYVLTAWHVIRDIQTAPESTNTPVPVTIYSRSGDVRNETAHLLKFDASLDIALLKLDTTKAVECGAKLASRERLRQVSTFEQIYAVGCPLGNDPIPTFGEVADIHHVVDGQHYWMISAPTYIGNSGGGVFDADTHELLGIFTKIYTHGTLRPTVIPHMGLATPLPAVYDWLDQVGFARLEPVAASQPETAAAAKR
jgi:S1-C subfamily serine protease